MVLILFFYLIFFVIENLIKKIFKIEYFIKEYFMVELMENLENGEIDIVLMFILIGNKKFKEFLVFLEFFVVYLNLDYIKIDELYYEISKLDIFNLLFLENEYCYNV